MTTCRKDDKIDRLVAVVKKLKAEAAASAKDAKVLEEIVARIRESALADFKERELPRFEQLHEALSGGGVPLAALSVCGYATAEARYTQLLRYFLDPQAPHGLKALVLRTIFQPEIENANWPINDIDFQRARVEAEVSIGKITKRGQSHGCTLDLLITLNAFHILVEQKITSPEDGSVIRDEYTQLERYSRAIDTNRPDISVENSLFLFLTPNRKEPRADSRWHPISHRELVTRCLELLEQDLRQLPRFNLCCFLWDLLSGPTWWQDAEMLDQFRERVADVVADPARCFSLKRWCAGRDIDWLATLRIVEACNG